MGGLGHECKRGHEDTGRVSGCERAHACPANCPGGLCKGWPGEAVPWACGNDGLMDSKRIGKGRGQAAGQGWAGGGEHWQKSLLRYAPLTGLGVAFGVLPAWLLWLGVRVSVCESN